MVQRTALCFCDECEKNYEVTKEFKNKEDADRWELAAMDRYHLCHSCYAKRNGNRIAERNNWAERKAERLGLPKLEGTEKQIAWANTIRINAYNTFDLNRNSYSECGIAFWNYVFKNSTTDAKTWIANRDNILSWARLCLAEEFIEEHPEFKGQKMKKSAAE